MIGTDTEERNMEDESKARLESLELANRETQPRLARIETRLETFATKEDLHRELSAQTWRFMTFVTTFVTTAGTLLAGAVFIIARYVH